MNTSGVTLDRVPHLSWKCIWGGEAHDACVECCSVPHCVVLVSLLCCVFLCHSCVECCSVSRYVVLLLCHSCVVCSCVECCSVPRCVVVVSLLCNSWDASGDS